MASNKIWNVEFTIGWGGTHPRPGKSGPMTRSEALADAKRIADVSKWEAWVTHHVTGAEIARFTPKEK